MWAENKAATSFVSLPPPDGQTDNGHFAGSIPDPDPGTDQLFLL